MIAIDCPACHRNIGYYGQNEPGDEPSIEDLCSCEDCLKIMPPSLIKACAERCFYVLKLRTGEVIHFESAVINGKFANLTIREPRRIRTLEDFSFSRGIEVRLSEIVWCADDPYDGWVHRGSVPVNHV